MVVVALNMGGLENKKENDKTKGARAMMAVLLATYSSMRAP
jgi:hypothetical protein